jgi:serine/threonine protein kinase
MKDDDKKKPFDPMAPLPTIIRGLNPEELFARGMQSVKMSVAGPQGPAKAPRIEEMARLFPGYEVLSLLGSGGMGAVYKARQVSLDRTVAIKLLPLEANRDHAFAERFRREAQTMGRLHHPNVVGLFDFGQTKEGHLYYVMEYVEGATLHDLTRTKGALNPERVVRIVGQICEGLAAAHREGVVHRDIKPLNILVDTHGQVKIADFGLSRSTNPNSTPGQMLTIKGMAVGTPDYMAPEQRRGERVDQRADIYAVGIVLYEALTGELPRGVFAPASQRAGTPPKLDDIIVRAMHQDPAKRFQSTMEMKLALDAISLQGGAPAPARGASPKPSPNDTVVRPREVLPGKTASAKKNRTGLWLAVAASVVVLGILGYALSRPAHSVRPMAPHYEPTPAPIAVATPAPKPPPPVVAAKPSPTAAPVVSISNAPTEPKTFGSSRYQLIRSQGSWMQAKTEAEFKGGHLAAITTPEEGKWIRETFGPEIPRKWARIWIGAYQAERDDTWHWVTDEEFKYTNWIPGEPNGARTNATPPYCASLTNSKDGAGANGWDDTASTGGTTVVGYLVEWDEPKAAASAPATPAPAPVAMATPAPAPAATPAPATPAPAVNEGEQRLALHKSQFDAAYARDIGRTFDAAREVLRTNYQSAIDREIARASQAGKVAEAVTLREERMRANTGTGLDSDPSALPAVLQPLRIGYRNNLARLETDRAARLKPIRDGYLKLLDASQAEFTKVKKTEAALVLKTERDKLAAQWAAETPVAPPAGAGVAAAKGTTPTTSDAGSSWRRAAQMVLRLGGKIDIKVEGKRTSLATEADIPTRRFEVVRIDLADSAKNEKLTEADLALVSACRELEELYIDHAPVTNKGLEGLRGLSTLRTLRLHFCTGVNDQFMPVVATLGSLTVLELEHDSVTREGLKNIARCTKLHRLHLMGRSISAAGLAGLSLDVDELSLSELAESTALDLSGFKKLKRLHLISMKEGKMRLLDEAAKLRGLEFLRFNGCDVTDGDLGKLSGLSNLKALELEQGDIKGPGLASLRPLRSLTRIRLNNCNVTEAVLDVIGRELGGLQILSLSGSATVPPEAFRHLSKLRGLREIAALDGIGNDQVASMLAGFNGLEIVHFGNCAQLTEAGLQAFARLKTLKRISLNNCTKLTPAMIEAFRKSRPEVTVND